MAALAWSYGGAVMRLLATLLVQLLLARLLGPEAYGQASVAFIVLALGWMLAEGGMGAAMIQKPELDERDVSHALGWVLLLSGGMSTLVMLSAPWLARWLGAEGSTALIMASAVLIPVQALSSIPVSLMRRNLDARRVQLIHLGGYVLAYALVGVPLALLGAGAWTLVIAFGLHSLFNLLGGYAVVRHGWRPSLAGGAALRRFGFQVMGTSAANWAIENLDRMLVSRLWGASVLGQYSTAFTLSRAPASILTGSIQEVAFSAASRAQDDPQQLARSYLASLNLLALLSWPLFALMAVHAEAIVHLLYGARWAGTAPLFAAFCAGLPFHVLMAVSGPLLWALGAVRLDLMVQVLGAAVLFGGFWLGRELSLSLLVWLVPLVFLCRALWFHQLLARRLRLEARSLGRALRGGGLLAAATVGMSLALQEALGAMPALFLASAATPLLVLGALRWQARLMLNHEVRRLLQSKAGESPTLRRLGRLLGLGTEAS